MKEYSRNLTVGVFVLIGFTMLGTLMVLYGERPTWFGQAGYQIGISMRELVAAAEGTPVFMNGVQIGRVSAIEFRDRTNPGEGVLVMTQVEGEYIIPSNATALVSSVTMGFGRGRVDIEVPGEPAPALPKTGATIPGRMAGALDDIIPPSLLSTVETAARQIGDFAQALTPAANDLHQLLAPRDPQRVNLPFDDPQRLGPNLSSAIEKLYEVLGRLEEIIGDPQTKSNLQDTLVNLRDASQEAKEAVGDFHSLAQELRSNTASLADRVDGLVVTVDAQVKDVGKAAIPALQNTAAMTATLNQVALKLSEGGGTAGLFLNDNRLYESLVVTSKQLLLAIQDLQRLIKKWETEGIDIKGGLLF